MKMKIKNTLKVNELTTLHFVKNSPFNIHENNGVYTICIGRYGMATPPFEKIENALKFIEKSNFNFIHSAMKAMDEMEKLTEKQNENE